MTQGTWLPPSGPPPQEGEVRTAQVSAEYMTPVEPNAYLVLEADRVKRLHFRVQPEQISDRVESNWSQTSVLGRWEPYRTWESTGPRTIGFEAIFFASIDQSDSQTFYHPLEAMRWLQSLCYPRSDTDQIQNTVIRDGLVQPPHIVRFIIGTTYNLRCIVRSVDASTQAPWSRQLLVTDINGNTLVSGPTELPMHVRANLSMEVVSSRPVTYESMVQGNRFIP